MFESGSILLVDILGIFEPHFPFSLSLSLSPLFLLSSLTKERDERSRYEELNVSHTQATPPD